MLEILAGTGLAAAAGLNAYIPLLLLGFAGRFLDFVELPAGWLWLENEWVLGILAVLLVLEVVADKIPAVDSINDWIQTIVRPTAGGIAFGTGAAAETAAVADPATFFESQQWVTVVAGIVIALIVHLTKTFARPVANTLTFGLAAPVLSTVEDVSSVVMSAIAIVLPILIIVIIPLLTWWAIAAMRRARAKRARAAAAS